MVTALIAHLRSNQSSKLTFLYFILSSAQLVILQALIFVLPHARVVLLLQLAISTLLGCVCYGKIPSSRLSASRIAGVGALAALRLLASWSCLHGLKVGISINAFVGLHACTPIVVTAAKAMLLGQAALLGWQHLTILIVIAASFSAQSAYMSLDTLLCMFAWFISNNVHCLSSWYIPDMLHVDLRERMFLNTLVDSLALVCMLIMTHKSSFLILTMLSIESASQLALSCALISCLAHIAWQLQAGDTFAMVTAVIEPCSKLVTLVLAIMLCTQHCYIDLATILLTAMALLSVILLECRHSTTSHGIELADVVLSIGQFIMGACAATMAVASVILIGATLGSILVGGFQDTTIKNKHSVHPGMVSSLQHKTAHWGLAIRWEAISPGKQSDIPIRMDPLHDVGFEGNLSGGNATPRSQVHYTSVVSPYTTFSTISNYGDVHRLKEAISKPINVVVMTTRSWELSPSTTENCTLDGIPLTCYLTQNKTGIDTADALYYHIPSFLDRPRPKAFPHQLRLAVGMESARNFPRMDDPDYMCAFDAEVSYRHCSQAVQWYSSTSFDDLFARKPLSFDKKRHAIVYINSNCNPASQRAHIMRELMSLNGSVPVHSLGKCDNNMPWPDGNPSKIDVQRGYKFCVAMENSISPDYVTEKLWDALIAGCIPVYMGATIATNMVPDRRGVILYDPLGDGDVSTAEQLAQLLKTIGSDEHLYESKLIWKYRKPEDQPNALFKHLWSVRSTTWDCFICQFLARHRINPQPRYTTCVFNATWASWYGRKVVNTLDHDGPCPPM